MLCHTLRARSESVLPLGLTGWAKAAREWRPKVKQRITSFSDRRGFWERFTERAWNEVSRAPTARDSDDLIGRSEEHTSELQSLMRISYAVFCLKKKK